MRSTRRVENDPVKDVDNTWQYEVIARCANVKLSTELSISQPNLSYP
jgi:hypothetical protein